MQEKRYPEKEFHRMSEEAYKQLVAQLPKLGMPREGIEAATLVGVQMVLNKLRDGFVIRKP